MNLVQKAFEFAAKKHEGQYRRKSKAPYFSHPALVATLCASKFSSDEHIICAAVLHDVLEDTDTTYSELRENFGVIVADLVYELTNDEDEVARVGKKAYTERKYFEMCYIAANIKLVDRLSNILDNPTKKYLGDTLEWMNKIIEKCIKNGDLKKVHPLVFEIKRECIKKLEKLDES